MSEAPLRADSRWVPGPLKVNLENLPFTVDQGIGHRATLGLIVLATDQTIEHEMAALAGVDGVAVYNARIMNDPAITPETLRAMEARIPETAALFPVGFGLDVIGYGCTSASLVIGEEGVKKAVHQAHPDVAVTNPVTAARTALDALGVKRVALLTPYVAEINHGLRERFEQLGLSIPVMGSFNEGDDLVANRISEASIRDAILKVGASDLCDGVFVSCTGLRVAAVVEDTEKALGKPVTSSNHALAWHMLRLGGITEPLFGRGALFQCAL